MLQAFTQLDQRIGAFDAATKPPHAPTPPSAAWSNPPTLQLQNDPVMTQINSPPRAVRSLALQQPCLLSLAAEILPRADGSVE